MEWLQTNWLPLLIVTIVVLCFIIWIIYLCKRKGLKETALNAILEAENHYHTTTGQERLDLAVDYMYKALPAAVTMFLSKEALETVLAKFIQKVFDEIKKALDYQIPAEIKKGE